MMPDDDVETLAATLRDVVEDIEEADEVLLLAKTRFDLAVAIGELVEAEHPYEVPALVFLPIAEGLPSYLDWLTAETTVPSAGA